MNASDVMLHLSLYIRMYTTITILTISNSVFLAFCFPESIAILLKQQPSFPNTGKYININFYSLQSSDTQRDHFVYVSGRINTMFNLNQGLFNSNKLSYTYTFSITLTLLNCEHCCADNI